MSALREALLFLDLDKGKDPLSEEQRRHTRNDPRLRSGWFQYQALRALAVETAPAPSERMVRAVLAQCRRENVGRRLSQIAGGDELAREILLGRVPKSRGLAPWMLGLLLLGALGLGWTVFRGDGPGMGRARGPEPAAAPGPSGVPLYGREDPVPFEFPVQTPPAEAALSAPVDDTSVSDADDVHSEPPAARQASRILREHLHEAEAREETPDTDTEEPATSEPPESGEASDSGPVPDAETAPRVAAPRSPPQGASAPSPADSAEAAPARADLALHTGSAAYPPAEPNVASMPPTGLGQSPTAAYAGQALSQTAALKAVRPAGLALSQTAALKAARPAGLALSPTSAVEGVRPGLTLSSDTLLASASVAPVGLTQSPASPAQAGPLDIALGMPQRNGIDVRLFTPTGRSARILAAGVFGPGTVHFLLDAKDDQGQALAPGTYYLRVMTPWFSRVEPIQIH